MPKTVAERLAGTPTRYTPPRCSESRSGQACKPQCACTYEHKPSTVFGDQYWGLVTRKDGSRVFGKPAKIRFTEGVLPQRTRENIAACSAVGLSFWSEAPNGDLWAVDAYRQPHLVSMVRSKGIARVDSRCPRRVYEELADHACSWDYCPNVSFTVTDDIELLALQLLPAQITEQPLDRHEMLRRYAENQPQPTSAPPKRTRPAKVNPCPPGSGGNLTAAEKRIWKAAKERRAAERETEVDSPFPDEKPSTPLSVMESLAKLGFAAP